jgi:hypothetical protein
MPKISEFFGIAIYMYFDDHAPPHFHAQYAEFEAVIQIDDFSVLRGRLPPRALGLVAEMGPASPRRVDRGLAPGASHADVVENPAAGVGACWIASSP